MNRLQDKPYLIPMVFAKEARGLKLSYT